MGKVYDFKTGKLCKFCEVCRFWKDANDFTEDIGKVYGKVPMCKACSEKAFIHKELTNEMA
jgi:superfamily II helicase